MNEFNMHFNVSKSQNTIVGCHDIRLMWLEAYSLFIIIFSFFFNSAFVSFGLGYLRFGWFVQRDRAYQREDRDPTYCEQYHRDIRDFIWNRFLTIPIYIAGAFCWNLIARNGVYTQITMDRWLIEATLDLPNVFFALNPPFGLAYTTSDETELFCIDILLFVAKFKQFVWMRHYQYLSRAWMNGLLIGIFHYLCQSRHHSYPLHSSSLSSSSNLCNCHDLIDRLNRSQPFF